MDSNCVNNYLGHALRANAGTAYTPMPARKGRQENTGKPWCTANPKAAQRSSTTGLKDEKKKRAEKGHGWHGNAQKLLKQHFQASFCI